MHNWFRLIRRITLPNKAAQAVARVAADQLIGGPFFPAIFFTSLTLLEGGSLQQVHDRLKKSWFRTWCIGVLVFTPASAINMTLIPSEQRPLCQPGQPQLERLPVIHAQSTQGAHRRSTGHSRSRCKRIDRIDSDSTRLCAASLLFVAMQGAWTIKGAGAEQRRRCPAESRIRCT